MGESHLTVLDDSNRDIRVNINDTLDIITNSTLIAQVFSRALVKIVTRVVASTVEEIVVSVGESRQRMELQLYQQQVRVKLGRLQIATEECARALKRAEENSSFPPKMKEEYIDRLYGLFYEEMSKNAPSGRIYK